MFERFSRLPLPSHLKIQPAAADSEDGLPQIAFDSEFPGSEYESRQDPRFGLYADQLRDYLFQEFPEVGASLEQNLFVIDDYVQYLLIEFLMLHTFFDTQQTALRAGDLVLAESMESMIVVAIRRVAVETDFGAFLQYYVAKRAAIYHPLFRAVPDQYYSVTGIDFLLKLEDQELTLSEEDQQTVRREAQAAIVAYHQTGMISDLHRRLAKLSTTELMSLALAGGEEALKIILAMDAGDQS